LPANTNSGETTAQPDLKRQGAENKGFEPDGLIGELSEDGVQVDGAHQDEEQPQMEPGAVPGDGGDDNTTDDSGDRGQDDYQHPLCIGLQGGVCVRQQPPSSQVKQLDRQETKGKGYDAAQPWDEAVQRIPPPSSYYRADCRGSEA
jgi:hypothetical protein